MKIKLSTLRRIIKEELKRSLNEGQFQGDSEEAQQLLRKAENASQNEDIQNLVWVLGHTWKLHDRVGLALSNALDHGNLMLDSDKSPVYIASDFIKELRKVLQRAQSIELLSNSQLVDRAEEDISDAEASMKQILKGLTKNSPVGEVTKDISLNVQRLGHDAIERLIQSVIETPKED
jgi:hypothetical protein